MTEALHKCSVSLSLSVGISNRVSVSVSWVILGISVVFQLWIRGLTEFHCIAEHSCRDSCETWPGHVYQGKWRQSHGDSRGPGRPGDASGAIRYLQHERMWKDVESSASLSLFEECCWDWSNVYTSPVWGAFSQHFLHLTTHPTARSERYSSRICSLVFARTIGILNISAIGWLKQMQMPGDQVPEILHFVSLFLHLFLGQLFVPA